LVFLAIYYSLVVAVANPELGLYYIYVNIVFIVECFIVSYFISIIVYNKPDIHKLNKDVYRIGLIASIITCYLLLNPDVNIYVKESLIYDTMAEKYGAESHLFRGFAIADGASFAYGITNALIILITIIGFKKNRFYLLGILPLLLSIIVNARTGLLVVIYGLIVVMICEARIILRRQLNRSIVGARLASPYRGTVRHAPKSRLSCLSARAIYRTVTVALLVAPIAYFALKRTDFSVIDNKTIEWGLSFFSESFEFLVGNDEATTYDALIGEMFFFPSTILEFCFGAAKDVYNAYYPRSDVGYVNQIFFGGIMYLSILMSLLFYMCYRLGFKQNYRMLSVILFGALLIANLKGSSFNIAYGFVKLVCIYYVTILANVGFSGKSDKFKIRI